MKKVSIIILFLLIIILIIGFIVFNNKGNTLKAPENVLEELTILFGEESIDSNYLFKPIVCPDVKDNILSSNQSKDNLKTGTILTKDYKVYYYDTDKLFENKNCMLVDTFGITYDKMVGTDIISEDNIVSGFYSPEYNFSVGMLNKDDKNLSIFNEISESCVFTTNHMGIVTMFACLNNIYKYDDYSEPALMLPEGENILFIDEDLIVSNEAVYKKTIKNEECKINIDVKCDYDYEKNDKLTNFFNFINYYSSSIIQDYNGDIYANVYDLD